MAREKIKVDPSEIKTRKKVSGYGLLGTKYKKNPKYRDKPRGKRVDIREMNESVREMDPFDQAIKEVEKRFNINLSEETFDNPHAFDDDQMHSIVDYVHDELLAGKGKVPVHELESAFHHALDDVPGFELGDRQETIDRLIAIYHQKYH